MTNRNTLPQGNSDAALTLAQLLATAVEKPIEADTLTDLQNGPTPTAGRVAEVGQQDYYLGDGNQWVAASDVSLGSSSEPLGATHTERETVSGLEYVPIGTDVQAVIDQYSKRNTLVQLLRGVFSPEDTIEYGQDTAIYGMGSDITDQPGFDPFDPPTILDFSDAGDVPAFQTDLDASYRPQRPRFRDFVVQGSGPANGKDAFGLYRNNDGEDVGLAEMQAVYVEDYQRGVNGDENTDSGKFYRCHFHNVNRAFWKLGSGNHIVDGHFWEFDDTAGETVVVETEGHGNTIHGNHMSVKNTNGRVIWFKGGARNRAYDNSYRGGYGYGIYAENSPNNIIWGNKFDGDPADTIVYLGPGTRGSSLFGNQYTGTTTNNPPRALFIESDHNRVWDSVDMSGMDETVRVAGGSFNSVTLNRYPDGAVVESGATRTHLYGATLDWSKVTDSGDRTTVNDTGKNAGDPRSSGQWNTNGYEGLRVWDTSNNDIYLYIAGEFRPI